MKMKRLALSTVAASVLAVGAVVPTVQAEMEISAEIGAASTYLWRGLDLGGAAVWGDLSVSSSGFYAGVWTSSGDAEAGTEYDLYFGYGAEFGDVGIDVGYATYVYPESEVSIGDLAEAYLGLSYGPASLTYFHGLSDLEDYWYVSLGVDVGSFNFSYGLHEDDMAHVDATYAYNDNLSFTLSKIIDDADGAYKGLDELKFVASFSLPLEF